MTTGADDLCTDIQMPISTVLMNRTVSCVIRKEMFLFQINWPHHLINMYRCNKTNTT